LSVLDVADVSASDQSEEDQASNEDHALDAHRKYPDNVMLIARTSLSLGG
jgi:hypothetical protein